MPPLRSATASPGTGIAPFLQCSRKSGDGGFHRHPIVPIAHN